MLPEVDKHWQDTAGKCDQWDNELIAKQECMILYSTLWLFNIAMENGPFIDGLPGFTY